MPNHSTPKQRVEYGLESIPSDRSVPVSLRDLMYVHQVLEELVQFFYQPMHYPDLDSVQDFVGMRGSGGAFDCLSEAYYKRMRAMLPIDMHDALGDGERFEHPVKPAYYEPPGPQ